MTFEPFSPAIFRAASMAVLPGWLLLLIVPTWSGTRLYARFVVPVVLGLIYVVMLASAHPPPGAGFRSLAGVMLLFTSPAATVAGWIHYLCFDLFIGCWQTEDGLKLNVSRWFMTLCLTATFLAGPLGLLTYLLFTWWRRVLAPLLLED